MLSATRISHHVWLQATPNRLDALIFLTLSNLSFDLLHAFSLRLCPLGDLVILTLAALINRSHCFIKPFRGRVAGKLVRVLTPNALIFQRLSADGP